MNKIIRNTIIYALALIAVYACSKDPQRSGATLNLDLRVVSSGTKTTGSGTIDPTEEEARISIERLRIFLVMANSEGDPISGSRVIEIPGTDMSEEDGIVKIVIPPIYQGSWLLYAVANWPSGLTINTDTYEDFVGAYSGNAATMSALWQDDNFLMVNTQNETDGCAGVPVTLDDQSQDLTVHLERLGAKIIARDSDMIDFAPYHTAVVGSDNSYAVSSATLKEVALINCVNSFYLTQRWEEPVTGEQNLVSPSSSLDYSMADGYYYNHPNGTSADLNWVEIGTPMYCLENNSPLYSDFTFTDPTLIEKKTFAVDGTKMKGRVTGVVFKAQFKIASGFTSEIGTSPINPDDQDMPGIFTKAGSSDEEAVTLYKYKSIYFADTDAILSKFGSDFAGVDMDDIEQLRAKGVNVYVDGYVYYTYWITDPNYTYQMDGKDYNRISVMRNTCYDLVVTNISAFGDEVPCGADYNPEYPLDTKYPKISLAINIRDWENKDYHYNL